MKILYKQPENDQMSGLNRFGIHNCYFKRMTEKDSRIITKKTHHHTGFEIHIVKDGYQEYAVGKKVYKLERGSFLLIYPNTLHTVISSASRIQKYSITFNKDIEKPLNCFFGGLSKRMSDNIDFILNECLIKKEISQTLIENNILEILVTAFRLSGAKENEIVLKQDENAIISLAKQYLEDNIEIALSVSDVSEYCGLSTKQLTRIFHKFEEVTPGEYIKSKRILRIEKLLADHTLSLKQISEIMNFDNEYYFNAFFKKHSGMPPGEYRKMLGK